MKLIGITKDSERYTNISFSGTQRRDAAHEAEPEFVWFLDHADSRCGGDM